MYYINLRMRTGDVRIVTVDIDQLHIVNFEATLHNIQIFPKELHNINCLLLTPIKEFNIRYFNLINWNKIVKNDNIKITLHMKYLRSGIRIVGKS